MQTLALALIAATAVAAADHHGSGWTRCSTSGVLRTTVFHGEYGLEAANNLSDYRNRLHEYMAEMVLSSSRKLRRQLASVEQASEAVVEKRKAEAPLEVVSTDPEERSHQPYYSTRYSAFSPSITCPPGYPLERVGKQGDGGKWLCGLNHLSYLPGRCVVYSFGSNGDYSFEEAVLTRTPCEVHTFDCTYQKGASIHERHSFHKVCLGQEDTVDNSTQRQYMRYSSLAASLNHTRIDILKMDIEGWEHAVVAQLHPGMHALPHQLTVEMHTYISGQPGATGQKGGIGELPMATTLLHLADLGYATVAKENNVWDPDCCTELTMLRVEAGTVCAKH